MRQKFVVRLSEEERRDLKELISKGSTQAYRIKHANILLKADSGGPAWKDERIAEAFGCHLGTVRNVRRRLIEGGLEAALARKPQARPSRARILDGRGEARLITLACSTPPEGRGSWTLELLAQGLVRLNVVERISYETVRRTLKKRPKAAPAGVLVHPAAAERRIRGEHGGCAGLVLPAV